MSHVTFDEDWENKDERTEKAEIRETKLLAPGEALARYSSLFQA